MSAAFLKLLCLATDLFSLFSWIHLIHTDLFFLQGLTLGGKKKIKEKSDLRCSTNHAVNFRVCGKAARSEQLECKGLFSPWEKQLSGHDVCPARLLLESKKQP